MSNGVSVLVSGGSDSYISDSIYDDTAWVHHRGKFAQGSRVSAAFIAAVARRPPVD